MRHQLQDNMRVVLKVMSLFFFNTHPRSEERIPTWTDTLYKFCLSG
jgi:hypothetical protein